MHEYKGYMCNYIYKWHCGLQVCIPEYWMNEDELQILKKENIFQHYNDFKHCTTHEKSENCELAKYVSWF